MGKYRKKPVVINAVQWTGEKGNLLAVTELVDGNRPIEKDGDSLIISTLEGDMEATKNDWIIKGVQGEVYPCKPDIFKSTYDEVK